MGPLDLKLGDKFIVLRYGNPVERIFVKYGKGSAIYVSPDSEGSYTNGGCFETCSTQSWSVIKEPEWVPFETIKEVIDELGYFIAVENKLNCIISIITDFTERERIMQVNGHWYNTKQMFEAFTKFDKTPFGKLKS